MNNHKLKIAIAEDEPDMAEFLVETLQRLGHKVIHVSTTGKQLVEQCRLNRPDLVITDIKMEEMDGLDAASQIYNDAAIPIVIVSAYHDLNFLKRAEENHILAYMVKPIKESDLGPAISIAMGRFAEFEEFRSETQNLRQALEDRKLIERAKGMLMKQAKLDEPAAFRRLQKLARDHNKKLVEMAQMIVITSAALQQDE